jgi:hypothetical protein
MLAQYERYQEENVEGARMMTLQPSEAEDMQGSSSPKTAKGRIFLGSDEHKL